MKAKTLALICLWVGRLLAVGLLLFWGAFFVEHMQEWFLQPSGGLPPAKVWISQSFHLTFLVGLALLWFRPRAGAIVTGIGTVAFFATIGLLFTPLATLNFVPIALLAVHQYHERKVRIA